MQAAALLVACCLADCSTWILDHWERPTHHNPAEHQRQLVLMRLCGTEFVLQIILPATQTSQVNIISQCAPIKHTHTSP